jgi:hypothetical protein
MDYVAEFRGENSVYMLVTRARILRDANSEEAFDLGEKSTDDMAMFAQTLYKASSASATDMQDALSMLRILLGVVAEVAGDMNDRQGDVAIQATVGRMWETAFYCMSSIESAHQEMLSKHGTQAFKQRLADEMIETERFLWCDWLCNMQESVVEVGELSKRSSLMQEFSRSSVLWWHARICEAIRHLDATSSI